MSTGVTVGSSVFLEVFALSQAVRALLLDAMAGGPLTPEEYGFYSILFEAESITPTEIAARLGVPKTTVMERVRVMEERGHARRVAHPRDGRSYHLVLTAAGLASHKRANERFEVAHRAVRASFPGDEPRARARLAQLRRAVTHARIGAPLRDRPRLQVGRQSER